MTLDVTPRKGMSNCIAAVYTTVLAGLAVYALHITILICLYVWHRRDFVPPAPEIQDHALPYVTVQVPLRNEPYVVQRVLGAVAALDWPKHRLEIQVLDDSDDGTTRLAAREVARLQAQGFHAHLLHRLLPTGHKAGALAAGLRVCKGKYIALFDADFCPPSDFLRRTVPYLVADQKLGMVQARWGHLNAEYSAITRAQALLLDAHFTIEHLARNRAGLLMNFNGTAGVWRRQTIDCAGGWQSDTVAEDLDLSYRAQLAGWKVLYVPDVVAPAEIPPLITAFKQQQYRWAKGAMQCLRKLALPILRSSGLTWYQKVMALLHLSGYLTQPMFLMLILLTLPLALYVPYVPKLATLFGTMTAILPVFYLLGQIAHYKDWPRRILYYPVLMALGLGITWNTTIALIDGLLNWGGQFARTPKFQLEGREGTWKHARPGIAKDRRIVGEVLIATYALVTILLAHISQNVDLMLLGVTYFVSMTLVIWGNLQLQMSDVMRQ